MATITKNEIIFDYKDWLSGLHPQAGVGLPILFDGFSFATAFNPFRFLGYASPGEKATDVTNVSVVTNILSAIEYYDPTQYGYAVGGAKLHQILPSFGTLTNNATYPHSVSGATMQDIVSYKVGTVGYLFYSWYDGTDGDVGQLNPVTDTFVDNFISVTPAGASVFNKNISMPMIVGDDDCLYIGNGNTLAKFDGQTGANGTLTIAKLKLPTQYQIKSFSKLSDRTLVIFASTNEINTLSPGSVKAYLWDYVSADPYQIFDVIGSKCGGAFTYKNSIGVFTVGASDDPGSNIRCVHLSVYDGQRFKKINSILALNEPLHKGVEVLGETIYANIEGNIWTFGSPFTGIISGVQKIARGSGATGGALKTLSSGKQLASTGSTTSGGLQILSGNYDTSAITTNFVTPVFNSGFIGKIAKIRVEFKNAVSGGLTLSLSLQNRDGVVVANPFSALSTVSSGKTIQEYYLNADNTNFGTFDGLQLILDWNTGATNTDSPIIKRVIIYYDEIEQLI